MTCTRCQGYLTIGYDEIERIEYVFCVNCGARPEMEQKRREPLKCVDCRVQEREKLRMGYNKITMTESIRCRECRVVFMAKRRQAELRRLRKRRAA